MCSPLRGIVAALGALVVLVGSPSESKAIFHWFRSNPCGCSAQATTYAPPFVPRATTVGYAPVGGCCTPYTACYAPQTCYRPVCVTRPVVTYMPVQACSPCGGCATVAYQPATTWVRQVRMVPYTSYRAVYSNPCVPCYSSCSPCASPCGWGGCSTGGCATGGCGVSSSVTYGSASGCSSCASSTTVVTPQPTLSPAPSTSAPAPTPAQAPTQTPAPSNSSAPGALPTPTFKNTQAAPEDYRMKPLPSSTSTPSSPLPSLGTPGNHTAQRDVYHAAYYFVSTNASSAAPAVKTTVVDDVDGWQVVK